MPPKRLKKLESRGTDQSVNDEQWRENYKQCRHPVEQVEVVSLPRPFCSGWILSVPPRLLHVRPFLVRMGLLYLGRKNPKVHFA